jgi:hypothetical protein
VVPEMLETLARLTLVVASVVLRRLLTRPASINWHLLLMI